MCLSFIGCVSGHYLFYIKVEFSTTTLLSLKIKGLGKTYYIEFTKLFGVSLVVISKFSSGKV